MNEDKEVTDTNVGNIEKDIKRCEKLTEPQNANWIGISNQLAIAHLIERMKELKEEREVYDTVLNLITKFKKENEELTTALSKQSKDISNYLVELQQKDKQIDLMAGYIANIDTDEDICKEQADNNCDDINREADCKDCIKQYFEKQVKEKGE